MSSEGEADLHTGASLPVSGIVAQVRSPVWQVLTEGSSQVLVLTQWGVPKSGNNLEITKLVRGSVLELFLRKKTHYTLYKLL